MCKIIIIIEILANLFTPQIYFIMKIDVANKFVEIVL